MGNLYNEICSYPNLLKTFDFLWKKNKRSGPDGISMYDLYPTRFQYLAELSSELVNYKYHASADVILSKPYYPGSDKTLYYTSLNVREKIVEYSIKNYLYPLFEEQLVYFSCAYRKKLGEKLVDKLLQQYIDDGKIYFISLDIKSFFKSISQDVLLDRLHIFNDKDVVLLISECLHFNHMEGLPVGHVLSPMLSNFYLNEIDRYLALKNYHVIRYADNYCFATDNRDELLWLKDEFQQLLINDGMTLNETKTKIIVNPTSWQSILV